MAKNWCFLWIVMILQFWITYILLMINWYQSLFWENPLYSFYGSNNSFMENCYHQCQHPYSLLIFDQRCYQLSLTKIWQIKLKIVMYVMWLLLVKICHIFISNGKFENFELSSHCQRWEHWLWILTLVSTLGVDKWKWKVID